MATLSSQAAEPVHVLDDLMATLAVSATLAAAQPPAALPATQQETPVPTIIEAALATPTGVEVPVPEPATMVPEPDTSPTPAAERGIVASDGRLNLRAAPDAGADIVRKLQPGVEVAILERSADGTWLRLQLDDGTTGWAAAEYVETAQP